MRCHISLKEELDSSWQEWFEPLALLIETPGETALRGSLPDQAALYRVLLKIQSLGLVLLSLETDGNSTSSSSLGERTDQRLFSDSYNRNIEIHITKGETSL